VRVAWGLSGAEGDGGILNLGIREGMGMMMGTGQGKSLDSPQRTLHATALQLSPGENGAPQAGVWALSAGPGSWEVASFHSYSIGSQIGDGIYFSL
jgi:hypothetical protein